MCLLTFLFTACDETSKNTMPQQEQQQKAVGIAIKNTDDFKRQMINLEFTEKETFHGVDYNIAKGVVMDDKNSNGDQRQYILATEPSTKKNVLLTINSFDVSSIDKREKFEAEPHMARLLDTFIDNTSNQYGISSEEYLSQVDIETQIPLTIQSKVYRMFRIHDKKRNETICGVFTNNGKDIVSLTIYMPNADMQDTCYTLASDFFTTLRASGKPMKKVGKEPLNDTEIKKIRTEVSQQFSFDGIKFKVPKGFEHTVDEKNNQMFHSKEFQYDERYGLIAFLKLDAKNQIKDFEKDTNAQNQNLLFLLQGDNLNPMLLISTGLYRPIDMLNQQAASWNCRLYYPRYTLEATATVVYKDKNAYLLLVATSKNGQDQRAKLSDSVIKSIQTLNK